MGRILSSIIVSLCCIILLAATSQAKTLKEVYLKDGGIIECQKVWQSNGKVMVLVNRDTLVDFSRDEVDLRKTFAKKTVKGVKKGKVRQRVASKPGAIMPQAAAQPPVKPRAVAATVQKSGTAPSAKPLSPNIKPSPSASPQPAAPAAKAVPPTTKPAAPATKPPPATPAVKPAAQATPVVKPAPPAAPAIKPVPPSAAQPNAAKPAVQGAATSAKKPAPSAVAPPVRTTLPVAKAPAPPPPKSFFAENIVNIGLVALLVILVAGYLIYKKRQ